MANIVDYDATAHNVHSVTVFQVDRAEVNRRINVQLKAGQNDVVVSHLPSGLDQDSIRVDGIGAATVFDVIYSPPPSPPVIWFGQTDTVKPLMKTRTALAADKQLLYRQAAILGDYAKTLDSKDTEASKLGDFLEFFLEKGRAINEGIVALDDKIAAVDAEVREEQLSSHKDVESQKRAVKLTIVVLSETDGDAELSLTYNVSGASWTPLYDLRASVTDAKESSDSQVLLHYRASIAQRTGEPWDGVHLTLSTASPQLGSDIPSLKPQTISQVYVPPPVTAWPQKPSFGAFGSFGQMAQPQVVLPPGGPLAATPAFGVPAGGLFGAAPAMASPFGTGPATMDIPASMPPAPPPPPPPPPPVIRAPVAAVSESTVSTTFSIEGLSTIPSDTDADSQTHKVSIAELTFSNVDLEWIAIPKEIPSVFLQCKVKNTSQYPLLPGQASVYLGNSFVAKSTISHVSPQESFSTSLGVDGAVRVTYHPQSKHLAKATGSLFASASNKTSTTSFSQRISVKNTRRSAVKKLVVRDQVPVSQDARIKVSVLEPKDIPGSVNGSGDVKARWALKNDDNPAEGETGDGMLEWVCSLPAGGNIDLNLAWDVTAPVGVQWRSSY